MNIWLSREFAAPEWGEGALLSHRPDGMVIHLVTASPLLDIQQAARRLCGQGIQKVALCGHWEREQQWAFAQGLQTPKAEVELQWATSDAGWSSSVARRAHNPKVVGSNPAPATNYLCPWQAHSAAVETKTARSNCSAFCGGNTIRTRGGAAR